MHGTLQVRTLDKSVLLESESDVVGKNEEVQKLKEESSGPTRISRPCRSEETKYIITHTRRENRLTSGWAILLTRK